MIIKGDISNKIQKIDPSTITNITKGHPTFSIIGGEFAITSDESGIAIQTLLGSCVAVMLYDRVNKIKAINHFLLPSCSTQIESYRFGLFSLEEMINGMYKLGTKKEYLVAKIAGGAKILSGDMSDIGFKNVEFARKFCDTEKIPLLSENVFGFQGRVVLLANGFETFIRWVENSKMNEKIKLDDESLSTRATLTTKKSKITLF